MQATYHHVARHRAEPEDLAVACRLVGDSWSLPLVASLLDGPRRYTEIQELLPGIAPNILTARLRRLEQEGLIDSHRYSARPPRFEYRLTTDGEGLADAIHVLAGWAGRRATGEPAPTHAACGTALETRWWCPACEVTASEEATESPIVV